MRPHDTARDRPGPGDLFFRRPRWLVLALAIILVAGLSAWQVLPRREDPSLTNRFGRVTTMLDGATAERVESLVTEPIEDELRDMEEIRDISSNSRAGISQIFLQLEDWVSDVDPVWSRVRDRLGDAAAVLPANASVPSLDDEDQYAFTIIAGLIWDRPGPFQPGLMRRLGLELQDLFLDLPGNEYVDSFGFPLEEVLVSVHRDRLAPLGIGPEQVAAALRGTDAKTAAGTLRGATRNVPLEVSGELLDLASVRAVPLLRSDDGAVVRVGDVADVARSSVQPDPSVALVDGKRAVVSAVVMADAFRVDAWCANVREELGVFSRRLPEGVRLKLMFDQSVYTKARLDDLLGNLLLGMGLVLLVMLGAMGWKAALVVGCTLPLTSLMVLAGMWWLGVPIHQMSVTGLILALGLLIDNAIVMTDEVRHRMAHGSAARLAVSHSVRHLAVPLLGSTLTTVLAFLPIVILPGPTGEFVGSIGLSVILALLSSLFLALTVVPTLAAKFGRRVQAGAFRQTWWRDGFHSHRLERIYQGLLGVAVRRPMAAVFTAAALPVMGFLGASQLTEQFFPSADRDQCQIEVKMPANTAIAETQRVVRAMREEILADPRVEGVDWYVGESAPRPYYNLMGNREGVSSYAQGIVKMVAGTLPTPVVHELQAGLEASWPEAQVVVRQFEQGPPFEAPIELRVFGPDLEILEDLGEQYRRILGEIPEVLVANQGLVQGAPKLEFIRDDEELRRAGLTPRDLAAALRANTEGAVGGSILEGEEEIPVRVRWRDADRGQEALLASTSLTARNPDGTPRTVDGRPEVAPLESLGRFRFLPDSAAVQRRDGQRLNVILGYLRAGVLPADVLAEYRGRIAASGPILPDGYRLQWGGETEQRNRSVASLLASVGVLITVMAAVLVLSFNSFRAAGIIALVGGQALGLGVFALWLFGYPFGFMAILGTLGLVGVAINDGIVVLTGLRGDPEASRGEPGAVRRVTARATRHVLATTVTTVAGFTPLLIAGGGFWPPLAVAIAGGVVGATLLALVAVPALWMLMAPRSQPLPRNQPDQTQAFASPV